MKLYIGGCFQGKREAVIKNENIKNIIDKGVSEYDTI